MTKICPKCHKGCNDEFLFCPYCGSSITSHPCFEAYKDFRPTANADGPLPLTGAVKGGR